MKDKISSSSPSERVNYYYDLLKMNTSVNQELLSLFAKSIIEVWGETPITTPEYLQKTAMLLTKSESSELFPNEEFAQNMKFLSGKTINALNLDVGLTPIKSQRRGAVDSQIEYFSGRFDNLIKRVTPQEEVV